MWVTKKWICLFSSKFKECVLVASRLPQLQLSLCIQCFSWFQSSKWFVIVFDLTVLWTWLNIKWCFESRVQQADANKQSWWCLLCKTCKISDLEMLINWNSSDSLHLHIYSSSATSCLLSIMPELTKCVSLWRGVWVWGTQCSVRCHDWVEKPGTECFTV